jgi:hypothetical protein
LVFVFPFSSFRTAVVFLSGNSLPSVVVFCFCRRRDAVRLAGCKNGNAKTAPARAALLEADAVGRRVLVGKHGKTIHFRVSPEQEARLAALQRELPALTVSQLLRLILSAELQSKTDSQLVDLVISQIRGGAHVEGPRGQNRLPLNSGRKR